jgi:nucleotide-binding universal stress UspA family protein
MDTAIRTILVATDFLQSSRLALDYAVLLAHQLGAKLFIVNAFELGPEASTVEEVDRIPSRTRKDAAARLQAFANGTNRAGVPATAMLVEGVVPDAIIKAVDKCKADLLVLGTQGVHRGLGHLLIGSNTEALMLRCPCPTLTIGPHVPGGVDIEGHFQKVVYISNFKRASVAAVPFALRLSRFLKTSFEVFHVVKDMDDGQKTEQVKAVVAEYCSQLRSAAPELSELWCNPEFHMDRLISPEKVLQLSLDSTLLMVVGTHGAPLLERHLRTSYPYRLLANAACPIISVRS